MAPPSVLFQNFMQRNAQQELKKLDRQGQLVKPKISVSVRGNSGSAKITAITQLRPGAPLVRQPIVTRNFGMTVKIGDRVIIRGKGGWQMPMRVTAPRSAPRAHR